MQVCRGTAVMLVSPTDGTDEIANPFVQPDGAQTTPNFVLILILTSYLNPNAHVAPIFQLKSEDTLIWKLVINLMYGTSSTSHTWILSSLDLSC